MYMIKLAEGFTAEDISREIKDRIMGISFHENGKIKLEDLLYLRVKHYDFDVNCVTGELICAKAVAKELLEIFYELYKVKYPIEKIRLVDEYDADDDRSMSDNNSSCFNYRVIDNTNVLSMHGLGRAVDINPLYNPYIVGEKIMPANGAAYADRSKDFEHKIDWSDVCYKIFTSHGWLWGGNWNSTKDYQHFYKPDGIIKRAVMRIKRVVTKKQ